jgi:HK97 family phage major capsid protein
MRVLARGLQSPPGPQEFQVARRMIADAFKNPKKREKNMNLTRFNTNSRDDARLALLQKAAALIDAPNFSKESSSRASALMDLADRLPTGPAQTLDDRDFETWLRNGSLKSEARHWDKQFRDLGVATPLWGGWIVPASFAQQLFEAMKAYDAIFDPAIISWFETRNGSPCVWPAWDDTSNASVIIAENQQEAGGASVDGEVTMPSDTSSPAPGFLSRPPTWRSGEVRVSIELLQDSGFDIVGLLARSFAVRHGRGISPSLITTLLSIAKLGVIAQGSGANTGGSETGGTSIGWADLCNLRKSVNPAYRASARCYWLMNDNTLAALDSTIDRYGRPLLQQAYNGQGVRTILGYPIGICPSMPNIGVNNKTIAFGDMSRFIFRVVTPSVGIRAYRERFADYGQMSYKSFLRCNGTLVNAAGFEDSPVKFLQQASS